ncbi:MAG: TIGR00341 family protein [Candidatus Nanohaloarchaea archaeon]|nr:TIGR00341 family protein [Candidatus Nanohaloarchaea archaeon]
MKHVEITGPEAQREELEEAVKEYDEDASIGEVERDGEDFIKIELSIDSDEVDQLTEDVKGIKEIESGDLTINVLEETATIEKGVRRQGGTWSISVQEMYTKAFSFSVFDRASWALIALASVIAVFGVVTENVMVVIGAMVIAPMLGPFIAVSFGLVIGDPKIIRESLLYGALSILLAAGTAFLVGIPVPTEPNPLMLLIAEPGFATIPLSLAVGSAAALTFMTEARENLAGIAVAIALVPPSAVVGLALAMENTTILIDVLTVLATNVSSLVLAGSVTFKLFGVNPSTSYREKVSEENLKIAVAISALTLLLLGGFIGYMSYQDIQNSYIRTDISDYVSNRYGERLVSLEVTATQKSASVTAVVVNPNTTESELDTSLESVSGVPVDLSLISLEGETYGG